MSQNLNLLNKRLSPENLEFRIQSINKAGYCTIFPYKDARYDQNVLDEVVGPGFWTKDYKVINNNLFCGIGIYVESIKEWVWKWDVGVESNAEKQKGEASDSFKRAGFCWGIGRELYSLPIITGLKLKDNEFYKFKVKGRNGEDIEKAAQTFELKIKLWKWEFIRNEETKKCIGIKAHDEKGLLRYNSSPKKNTASPQPTSQKPILTEKAKNFKAICAALEDGTRTMAMLDEVLEIKGPIRDVLEKIEAIRVANKVINQTK